VLVGKPGVSNRFLLHQLNAVDYHKYVSGSTRLKLPQAPMKQIPLVLAPEAAQNRVVAEIEKQFTRLDAATAALKRVQSNLKRYRASVLKAACEGRLVPTEAELARKEGRDYEPADKLLKRILRERRARWESDTLTKMIASGKRPTDDRWKAQYAEPCEPDLTGLNELPGGWAWTSLEAVAEVIDPNPSHRMPKYVVEDGVPFISSENFFGESGIDFTIGKQVSAETLSEQIQRFSLRPGCFALSRIGTIGKTRVLPLDRTYCLSHALVVIQSTHPEIHGDFLRLTCSSSALRQLAHKRVQSVGVPDLGMGKIRSFPVPIVPEPEQARIVAEAERQLSITDEYAPIIEHALVQCNRLRQSVLAKAFSGGLTSHDPADEPATAMLDRIRANAGSPSARKATRTPHPELVNG
jgi:type I restriction enzyme S subunit